MDCIAPRLIANRAKEASKRREKPMLQVPCGRCIACSQRKARGWALRLSVENKEAKTAYFITLTYNDETLPINEEFTYSELLKTDLINFLKRLRRRNEYKYPEMGKMKYYACGEYGGQTGRPHYHIILFNSHQKLNKNLHELWYRTGDKTKTPLGNIDIQDVNMDAIHYVSGYVMKRDLSKSDHLNRQREFAIMSKGLGEKYIEWNTKYHQENLTFLTEFQGNKMAIPEYYKKKIFTDEQREEIGEEAKILKYYEDQKRIKELESKNVEFPEIVLREQKRNQARSLYRKLKKDKH